MARSRKLFTIGYEQTPSKAVLDELERAGVKLLIDVRAVVSSRRPGNGIPLWIRVCGELLRWDEGRTQSSEEHVVDGSC